MSVVGHIFAHLVATSRQLANAIPIDVSIVDASGNQVTSFGGSGGTASGFGSAFPASGTAAGASDGVNMQPLLVDGSGNLKVSGSLATTPPAAGTSALSNVSDSITSVTALSANAARLGFTLYNDSTSAVRIKFGATASSTSFTKKMLPNEFLSSADIGANYTGKIDAIWDTAPGGAMRVTELSA